MYKRQDEIETVLFTIPNLPGFRDSELSFSRLEANFWNTWKVILTKDEMPYNALGNYLTMYGLSIPFAIIGTVRITMDLIKDIILKKYSAYHVIAFCLYAWLLLGMFIGGSGPNINRLNGIFFALFFCVLYGMSYIFTTLKKWLYEKPVIEGSLKDALLTLRYPERKLAGVIGAASVSYTHLETIIAVLSKVARYADPYSEIEKYENILKNIISYSHVKTFLINTKQKQAILLNYYNELKELNYYKENSFYWLQFSIACMDIERYDLAQTYLNDAYSWFRESENVVPFQVDTQQAKLYLLLIEKRKTLDIRENFLKAHELLMKPIISVKDNPVKQILNFGLYTNKTIKNQMITKGYEKEYCRCCAEAYNKVRDYLNHSRGKSDQNNLVKLSKQLLQCSIENENPI